MSPKRSGNSFRGPHLIRHPTVKRWVEFACGATIVVITVYCAYLGKLFSPHIDPNYFRDFGILSALARYVFEHGHYQIGAYFYPPSNAVYIHLVTLLGEETAFRLHLITQSVALMIVLVAWLRIIRLHERADPMRITLCAFLAALFYVGFELRMHNINMLCLGLVSAALWLRRRTWFSGLLFAMAIALKPYGSILILPWMFWNHEVRWGVVTAIWCIILMALMPIAWFGFEGTLRLYGEWLLSVRTTNHPDWILAHGFSLGRGIAELFDADLFAPSVKWVTRSLQLVWIVMVGAFFAPTLFRRSLPCGPTMASEVSVLLMAPLPLGGLQQIARNVVILVPLLVLSGKTFDRETPVFARTLFLLTLLLAAVLPRVVPVTNLQCIVTLGLCCLILLDLALAKRVDAVAVAVQQRNVQAPT